MSMTATAPAGGLENREMNGPEKVAALLLGMGKPLASRLLKHFDAVELKLITRAAAALGAVPLNTLEQLVEELASQFANGLDLLGSAAEVEHLLGSVLPPDQVADIMSDALGSSNSSTWVRLSDLPEKVLAEYIGKEHPQTAALILSRLTPAAAARTLAQTPSAGRTDLTRRMLTLRPVSEPTIRILETKLRDDLLLNPARDQGGVVHTRIADILNRMETDQMEEVLTSLEATRPEDATALRGKLFSFADVVNLTPKARSVLFDKVPTDLVVLSLKGTDPEFRDLVLSAIGARARRLIENELKNEGGTAKEVNGARRSIANMVLEMASRGELEIHADGDAE